MHTERLGCIDIGSNTTRLLVADRSEGQLDWVHQERVFTCIGAELLAAGRLRPGKIEEVVAVVAGQLRSARARGAARVRIVATAAVRRAVNGDELIAALLAATRAPVDVLSDAEEARLAFVGVTRTQQPPCDGVLGVVDVGGGSSELVVGEAPGHIAWWASLPVGSASLAGPEPHGDPPSPTEIEASRARIAAALEPLDVPRPPAAIAAGGSATSLGRLVGPVLDPGTLRRAIDYVTRTPAAAVAARFGIDPRRARLLPTGLLILEGAAAAFGVELRVGRGGIREGVLLEA